jgi:hypothetical protein
MSGRTRPEGYPAITEPTKKHSSMSFVISLSVILGVVIAAGTILGFVGDSLFVSRNEYNDKRLKDMETDTTFKQTLNQVDKTLSAQAASFKELTISVDAIRLDMARRK